MQCRLELSFHSAYYYFYERARTIILSSSSRRGGKGLSTVESMLAGLIAGSATTVISNPIWVVQTSQAVRSLDRNSTAGPTGGSSPPKRMGLVETVEHILRKDGIGAFWRGIGPALVLVMNPVLQYTVFEQLKNFLVRRRTARLKTSGSTPTITAVLTDWDYFFLGALSKLGKSQWSYNTFSSLNNPCRSYSGYVVHLSIHVRAQEWLFLSRILTVYCAVLSRAGCKPDRRMP